LIELIECVTTYSVWTHSVFDALRYMHNVHRITRTIATFQMQCKRKQWVHTLCEDTLIHICITY